MATLTLTTLTEYLDRMFIEEADDYVAANLTDAIDSAQEETWSLPQSSNFKVKWLKERATRHLMNFLLISTAPKFHAKSFKLQQKWEHWRDMIAKSDEDFAVALEENISEFADVDSFNLFGSKVDAGFSYDHVGRDTTYTSINKVEVKPDET